MRRHLCAAAAVLALAGCADKSASPQVATAGGGATSSAEAPAQDPAARARQWADCMRAKGVRLVENGEGNLIADKQANDTSTINDATAACLAYVPPSTEASHAPVTQEDLEKLRERAACIRQHGVADWPDPDPVTGEQPELPDSVAKRLKSDPHLAAALAACPSGSSDHGVQGG